MRNRLAFNGFCEGLHLNQPAQTGVDHYGKASAPVSAATHTEPGCALLDRPPVPGMYYASIEVVLCNSRPETGVPEALGECTRRSRGPILEAGPTNARANYSARPIRVLGP